MDEGMRNFERAAAQGDVEAKARLLLELVRAGRLPRERLEWAAHLGEERARIAIEGGEKVEQSRIKTSRDLKDWVIDVAAFSKISVPQRLEALVRSTIALAWQVLGTFEDVFPGDVRPRQSIEAAERWVLTSPEKRPAEDDASRVDYISAAEAAFAAAEAAARAVEDGLSAGRVAYKAAYVAARASRAAADAGASETDHAGAGISREASYAGRVGEMACAAKQPEILQKAILDELVPWLLNEGDPIKERVEQSETEE